jgi:TP901 family phage tail tape measure protein
MRQVGSGMAIAGGAMGLPMVLAARQAATFEDALLELQGAVSDITPDQMRAVREEAIRLSRAMGVAPEKIAQSFTLLIKAGMGVEDALRGGAKAATEFARVSGVEAADAAEFMKVAMNVFGISATQAADTLSAAADSSETSIASMVESFALVASVAKGTGQSLFGLSQGLAVLARYGIKGEEAGTGIKTLLVKLLAPAKDAKDALATLGLSMESLVDQTGKLLPLAQLAGVFRKALGGMGKEARDAMLANEALVKVFDVRGIRVIQAFSDIGEEGFNNIATAMESSRTVSEKFSIAMSGITGSFERLYSAVQRMAIAFMVGAAPALSAFAAAAVPVMDFMAFIFTQVPIISPILAGMAVGLFGVGLAALGAGAMLGFMNFGLKNIINFRTTFVMAVRAMTSVIGNFSRALVGLRVAMLAIPGWGWALAALAAAGGAAAWMMSGSGSTAKGKGSGIKRDANRDPLANPMGGGMAAQARARGEALGTFSAAVASQLGIGPALTAADETAANTGRMADGVDALVRQGEARMPGAAALQAGMVPPGVRGGVAARSDRDLVSMSERAAIAAEESRTYLRQLVEKARDGGLAFA